MLRLSGTRTLRRSASSSRSPAGAGCAAPAAAAAAVRVGRRRAADSLTARAAQADPNDFGESVKRIAKKIQGSLPIIGLLSRLASPEGGFDEIAYPEFCRTVYDTATPAYFEAVTALEKAHGKPATHRALLMTLWMARHGVGLVPLKDMVAAAKRVRVSQDIEVEIDRFEGNRDVALKKFGAMGRPPVKLADQIDVAVDGLATLALGLGEGKPIPPEDADRIAALVAFVFPEAGADAVRASVAARESRSYS